jgi:hypothetical protein
VFVRDPLLTNVTIELSSIVEISSLTFLERCDGRRFFPLKPCIGNIVLVAAKEGSGVSKGGRIVINSSIVPGPILSEVATRDQTINIGPHKDFVAMNAVMTTVLGFLSLGIAQSPRTDLGTIDETYGVRKFNYKPAHRLSIFRRSPLNSRITTLF